MQKIAHIIDGGCAYHGAGGKMNHENSALAKEVLESLGYEVTVTRVEDDWNREVEGEKLRRADAVILQVPAWWMAAPWQVKRYMDEVLCTPGIITSDGRSHTNPAVNYGRGGLLKKCRAMISMTWNAPANAFTAPEEFFEGKGIEAVVFPMRKMFEFVGMSVLPTFMANDVLKNPTREADLKALEAHIRKHFA